MPRKSLGVSVFDAGVDRFKQLYTEGDDVIVGFSAGKDSGVCLELAIIAARETGNLPVKVVMRDEEIMFPGTYEYAERVAERDEVEFHWVIAGQPVINIFDRVNPYWWVFDDRLEPEDWVRIPPSYAKHINEQNIQQLITRDQYSTSDDKCLTKIIGLRTGESPQRQMGLHSAGGFKTKEKGLKADCRGTAHAHPIYDWTAGDVWKAVYDNKWDYNSAYDIMARHGHNRKIMRISPPTQVEAGVPYIQTAFKAFPKWGQKVAERLEGVRLVAQFGVSALRPIRRSFETWEDCYQRTCIDTAPAWIANRAEKVRERAVTWWFKRTQAPFPEVKPDIGSFMNFGSWKRLSNIMFNGDPFALRLKGLLNAGEVLMEPEDFRADLPENRKKWGGTPTW